MQATKIQDQILTKQSSLSYNNDIKQKQTEARRNVHQTLNYM